MNPVLFLKKNLELSIQAKKLLLANDEILNLFSEAVQLTINRYQQGGRIYIAGNGGSAADAQHLAAEFVSKLSRDRAPLPAEALTVDSSILTAIGNDYGYDLVFARQIAGKLTSKDLFLGITTSGQSKNILQAIMQCKSMSVPTIIFSGKDGGNAKLLADYCIVVPSDITSTIQELHIVLAHTLCECVERAMFSELFQSSIEQKVVKESLVDVSIF